MDFPLLFLTVAVFAGGLAVGKWEYRRLADEHAGFTLNALHQKPGAIRWVLLVLTIASGLGLYFSFQKIALYRMPDWLDLSLHYLTHGVGALLFGLLGGLGWAAWRREHGPDTRALVLTAHLCLAGLITTQFTMFRYVAGSLNDFKFSGSPVMQSSSSSCAAASGASVAGLLGLRHSEREMARYMGTRVCGTSPAAIIRGMRRVGLNARFFEQDPSAAASLPLPSILFFNHPGLGPESHAVAAVRWLPKSDSIEIWDPLQGDVIISRQALPHMWAGRGVAVSKKAP